MGEEEEEGHEERGKEGMKERREGQKKEGRSNKNAEGNKTEYINYGIYIYHYSKHTSESPVAFENPAGLSYFTDGAMTTLVSAVFLKRWNVDARPHPLLPQQKEHRVSITPPS